MSNTAHTIVLVSCVGRKLDHAAPARDLYQSQWFKAARAYAEAVGDRWYILSAKHGLVAPTAMLEPYEQVMPSVLAQRRRWAREAAVQIRRVADPRHAVLVFLAGVRYREPLANYLSSSYEVVVPMRGLGIGQQLKWLHDWKAQQ